MNEIIVKYLKRNNLLEEDNVFIVAFSGGFDSMCLSKILIELSQMYHFKIVLAHLNHNWRGDTSRKEAENCRKFALENNVEFHTETLDENLPHTETVAREARYTFLENVAKKYNTNIIITAHTKSDNIETVLQRIIKGTGISGLKGIQEKRILKKSIVYRPMLECSRQDILNYCKLNNLTPNNDDSNKDTKYFRNKIRENLLPELKKNYDANIEEAIYRLIQNAKDAEHIIEELSEKKLPNAIIEDTILTKEFIKFSTAMKRRTIKELLKNNYLDYDQKRINDIIKFIEDASFSKSGKTFSLAQNLWLYTNNITTEIINEQDYNTIFAQKELNIDGETVFEEFNTIVKITNWKGSAPQKFPKETENVLYADLSKIELPLTIRPRLYGDKITPFGKNSPIKLKKYLNNKKLSKHEKSKVLLISSPKEVLWVINVGISNNIKVTNLPTHKIEIYKRSKDGN